MDDATRLTTADERGWIERAKQGDQAAFEAIFQRYERQIYSFIYRMMGDADDAYDLTQDCFVKAYKALGKTSQDLNLSAWLHRIASNACLDVLRRRQRLRWLPWEGPKHDHLLQSAPADDPERSAISHETRVTVQRVLDRMTHRHRLALILREYEGLSCAEIGQVMSLSRSAVKSMLFRAREEFRRVVAAIDPTTARPAATRPRAVIREP
ncbi:MAG: RNA polymerase sigma factor [Chloroflexi bacterium]|nr:RNA polymerase sigma factor [Chloroflexota bacterium]